MCIVLLDLGAALRKHMNEWIIIGEGKSRRKVWDSGCLPLHARVATFDDGVDVCAAPSLLLITDMTVAKHLEDKIIKAKRAGTRVLAHPANLQGVPGAEYFSYDLDNVTNYTPRRIAHGRNGGVVCTQAALMEGAKKIHLVGFDGFGPDEMEYEVEMEQPVEKNGKLVVEKIMTKCNRHGMNESVALVMGKIIYMNPDVQFVWWAAEDSWVYFPEWDVMKGTI